MGSRPLTCLKMACALFSLGLILTTSTTSLADDLEPLLGDPDLSKVNFYLWTPENPVDHQEVQLDLVSLLESNFDPARPTKILSHGWNSHGRGYGQDFAPIFLEVGDYNIFSIDWGDLENWVYPTAAIRTTAVGRHAAVLVQLMVEAGSTLADVHLVGHSLGAHVVGFLGKKVQDLGLGKVARVTGLDPAKPLFEFANATGRIDKGDADFVDIIHTNSGNLWEGCLSFQRNLGHIDFYPAGGSHQPGCTEACLGQACVDFPIEDLIKGGCSHERANQYFKESIRSFDSVQGTEFVASACTSYEDWGAGVCCGDQEKAVMGEWLQPFFPSSSSSFYLEVGENPPYAQGDQGLPC